jgi:hypothetical protein
MTKDKRITELLDQLDGSGSDTEYEAIYELRKLGNSLPSLLLGKFRSSKKWQVRSSCVYHAIRYARSSSDSVQLGLEALSDRSYVVRYRACMLLAYSLNRDALPSLRMAAEKSTHAETICDIRAAIDALENSNSDYFVDRDHTGNMTLTVS